jgi:hypothetical protein
MKNTLKNVLASPAAWFFTAVWLASLGYLLWTGNGVIGSTAFALGILVFSAITVFMTEDQTEAPAVGKEKITVLLASTSCRCILYPSHWLPRICLQRPACPCHEHPCLVMVW